MCGGERETWEHIWERCWSGGDGGKLARESGRGARRGRGRRGMAKRVRESKGERKEEGRIG